MRVAGLLLLMVWGSTASGSAPPVNTACAAHGATYVHVHGSLQFGNGNYPNLRLGETRTERVFGIYGGTSDVRCHRLGTCPIIPDRDDFPALPANLDAFDYLQQGVTADFTLRLLPAPETQGYPDMIAACIVSARHIRVDRDKQRASLELKSTGVPGWQPV